MYRGIALILALSIGGLAAWQVFVNLRQIKVELLMSIGLTGTVALIVTLLFYLPLFRHIADAIEDRFATIHSRLTAKKVGLGFDEVPQHGSVSRRATGAVKTPCGICGGPGGPVCEKCHGRMSRI